MNSIAATNENPQKPQQRQTAKEIIAAYTFARVVASVSMRVEDYFVQARRGWVRRHEKGGAARNT